MEREHATAYLPEIQGLHLLPHQGGVPEVRHELEQKKMTEKTEFAWLIEAPGIQYLTARKIGNGYVFKWTKDHLEAIRFYTEEQADLSMMAIRELDRDLFGFAVTLGDAKAVEHSWLPMHRQTA